MFLRKAPKVDNNRFTDHLRISFELCTCEIHEVLVIGSLMIRFYSRKLFVTNLKLSFTKKLKSWNYVFVNTKCVMYDDNYDYVIMII